MQGGKITRDKVSILRRPFSKKTTRKLLLQVLGALTMLSNATASPLLALTPFCEWALKKEIVL